MPSAGDLTCSALSLSLSHSLSLSLSFSTSFTSGPLSYAATCAGPATAPCLPSTGIHATCCPTPLPFHWCRVSSAASTTSGPPCRKAFCPARATTRWALWVTPTGCRRPLTCGLASRLRGEGAPTSAVASSENDDFVQKSSNMLSCTVAKTLRETDEYYVFISFFFMFSRLAPCWQ